MYPIEYFRKTIERFVDRLEALEVRFHLTGGIVSVAWGEPRLTQDIDVVVDRDRLMPQLDVFLKGLHEAGFLVQDEVARAAIASGRPFQLLDPVECLKLDLYPRELVAGELDRSIVTEVFVGAMLPVVSRRDAAVSKLIWIHKGSHKSRQDLRRLAGHLTEEDWEFLRQQANERHLTELLMEVLEEQDEIQE